MPSWPDNDLLNLLGDSFTDGVLSFNGQSTPCILRARDMAATSLGHEDLVDRTLRCIYTTSALVSSPVPGSAVTIAGATYNVRHKLDEDGGTTSLYVVGSP